MQRYFAAVTILLLICMVLIRTQMLGRKGIRAINFGKLDKRDFIIPPFALFYFYLVFANALALPTVSSQKFFTSDAVSWIGDFSCLAGLIVLLFSLISFGKSFRVGIDTQQPDKLVTSGIFALSRNPIYVAFGFVLIGQFLVFPNWILLIYLCGGILLFHRQVLREEQFLRERYGSEYFEYRRRVRRYF